MVGPRKAFLGGATHSDHVYMLQAYVEWRAAKTAQTEVGYCREYGLVPEAMVLISNVVARVVGRLKALGLAYNAEENEQLLSIAVHPRTDAFVLVKAALCAALAPRAAYAGPSGGARDAHGRAVAPAPVSVLAPTPPAGWVVHCWGVPERGGQVTQCTAVQSQFVVLFAAEVAESGPLRFDGWSAREAGAGLEQLRQVRAEYLQAMDRASRAQWLHLPFSEDLIDSVLEVLEAELLLEDVAATAREAVPASSATSARGRKAEPEPLRPRASAKRPLPPEEDVDLPLPKRQTAEGWRCENIRCLAMNANHLVECAQCGAHYWDWPCGACGHMNELRRSACESCRAHKTADQAGVARALLKQSPALTAITLKHYSKILTRWLRHEAPAKGLPCLHCTAPHTESSVIPTSQSDALHFPSC